MLVEDFIEGSTELLIDT